MRKLETMYQLISVETAPIGSHGLGPREADSRPHYTHLKIVSIIYLNPSDTERHHYDETRKVR